LLLAGKNIFVFKMASQILRGFFLYFMLFIYFTSLKIEKDFFMKKNWLLAATIGSLTWMGQIHANNFVEWSNNDCCVYDECCQESKILIAAEFLWWTQGTYFPFGSDIFINIGNSVSSPVTLIPEHTNTVLAPYTRISEKWSPGVRVGLGWESADGDWQLWGTWTGYSNYSRRVLTARGPALTSLRGNNLDFTIPPLGAEFSSLNTLGVLGSLLSPFMRGHETVATHKLNYNVADLVFGRALELGYGIELMPYVGVRATFINQQDETFFSGNTLPIFRSDFSANTGGRIKDNQHVWGVGPRVGLGATWGNWYGFNLIGNISAALLYGRYKEYGNLSEYGPSTTSPVIITYNVNARDRYNQIIPNLQAQLGLGYEIDFCLNGSAYGLEIFAMWEGNAYWGAYNHFFRERMLGLNGLTTGFAFSW